MLTDLENSWSIVMEGKIWTIHGRQRVPGMECAVILHVESYLLLPFLQFLNEKYN